MTLWFGRLLLSFFSPRVSQPTPFLPHPSGQLGAPNCFYMGAKQSLERGERLEGWTSPSLLHHPDFGGGVNREGGLQWELGGNEELGQ